MSSPTVEGDWWLVLEHEVLSKASATWHLFSLVLTSLTSLFSCTSCRLPFFFPSAPSLFDSFCTPGMTFSSLPSYFLLLFLSNTSFLCDFLDCQCYWFYYLIKLHFQLHFPVAQLICFSLVVIYLGLFSSKFIPCTIHCSFASLASPRVCDAL